MPLDNDKPITKSQARKLLQEARQDYLAGNAPEVIDFKLKRSEKANHTYSLKLTQLQRQTLLEHTSLRGKLKKKIEQAGEGTQVVPVTWNELHTLSDETGQSAVHARSPHNKRLMAVMSRVIKFFEEEHADVFQPEPPKPSNILYQFKITLLGTMPPIWRRIQVQDCTLDKLHEHIQTAMGWTNSHMHQFEINGKRYGDTEFINDGFDDSECVDSTRITLGQLVPETKKRFAINYEYDFGDGWEHEVVFEGTPPFDPKVKYPVCLAGERACPPEDCGGVWGYYDFLKAIHNPKHEDHADMLEWIGGSFDPEAFDVKQATKDMRKGLFDWRKMR
jgi:hypothetical protein